MTDRTLNALRASVAHWERNVERANAGQLRRKHIIGKACPLCSVFGPSCFGCPLFEAGQGCEDEDSSPWKAVSHALAHNKRDEVPLAAENMLAALRQLLKQAEEA